MLINIPCVIIRLKCLLSAGKKRKLICYLGKYPQHNHTINNEPIGKNEWQDLQGGMTVVNDLVERQGIPVFDLMDVALECATKVHSDEKITALLTLYVVIVFYYIKLYKFVKLAVNKWL